MHNIAIKIEGIERRKRSTGLFHIIAGFFLLVNAGEFLKQSAYQGFWFVLPVIIVAIVSLVYGFFRNRLDPSAQYNHWVRMLQFLMFSILGIYLLKTETDFRIISLFLWAIISILLLFTERKIFHDAYLAFNPTNITIPGYFSNKVIPWEVVSGVNVRPDFVTIHYPDNKYDQYEVLQKVDLQHIETINKFCSEKLVDKVR